MFYVFRRRRFRNRLVVPLIIFGVVFLISLIIHSDPKIITSVSRNDSSSRLFCVLLLTHSTHETFVSTSHSTWAKNCYKVGIVKYKRLQTSDNGKLINNMATIFRVFEVSVNQ